MPGNATLADMNGTTHPGVGNDAALPPFPAISWFEWYDNSPYPVIDSVSPTIGWQNQPPEQGGPAFVILTRSAFGSLKVTGRYPLTEDGWVLAWQALEESSPQAAATIRQVLAARPAVATPRPYTPAPAPAPTVARTQGQIAFRTCLIIAAVAVLVVIGIFAFFVILFGIGCIGAKSGC